MAKTITTYTNGKLFLEVEQADHDSFIWHLVNRKGECYASGCNSAHGLDTMLKQKDWKLEGTR